MAREVEKLGGEHIQYFARAVYSQEHEKAVLALLEILHAIEVSGLALHASANDERLGQSNTILAAAITALICDPKFNLSRQGFSAFMVLKSHLRSVFSTSGFTDMSHIVSLITNSSESGMRIDGEVSMQKFLLVCTMDIAPPEIVEFTARLDDEPRFLFWLSCMDNKQVWSEKEDELRQQMLSVGNTVEHWVANSIGEVQAVTRAWMYCSYWDYPDKHSVKKILNNVLRNTLFRQHVTEPKLPAVRIQREKPKLLVVLELWRHNSAMYRCFVDAIIKLKPAFQLVAIAQNDATDDESVKMFDEVIEFGIEMPIKELVDKVLEVTPDVIFYPSIGMQQTAIQFAQLRLAPIQIMGGGHPASSFSKVIDYIVFEEELLADPECFSEKVMLLKSGAISHTRPVGQLPVASVSTNPTVINIAVNSIYFKVTQQFLRLCGEIEKDAMVPVHFHFVMGLTAFNRNMITRSIGSHVQSYTCYDFLDYENYLKVINGCDIQLAPFPFGNTNSFVDSVLLGLPNICMDGPEIHSHNDTVFSRRVGMPDFCIARSNEEYKEGALKLIHDNDLRVELSKHLLAIDVDRALFGAGSEQQSGEVVSLFQWIYANHEKIQASSRKIWNVGDRALLENDRTNGNPS